MHKRRFLRASAACTIFLASASLSTIAYAQEITAPERALYDDNGVNVATGQYRLPRPDLSVGSGPGALTSTRIYGRLTLQDARLSLYNITTSPSSAVAVGTGDRNYVFTPIAGGFSTASDGTRLVSNAGTYQLIASDGTKYTYSAVEYASKQSGTSEVDYPTYAYLSTISYASGLQVSLNWSIASYCALGQSHVVSDSPTCSLTANSSSGPPPKVWITRLGSVSDSAGYHIDYAYAGSSLANGLLAPTSAQLTAWKKLTGASAGNAQNGSGTLPSVSYNYVTSTPSTGGTLATDDVTDALGQTWHYTKQTGGSGSYEAVRRPGSGADNVRVNMDNLGHVTSLVVDGATWTYAFSNPSSTTSNLVVTDPIGRTKKYLSDLTVSLPTRVEDEYGRATVYAYDANKRLRTATSAGGQVSTYDYDAAGNLTKTLVTAVGGATMSSSATYRDFPCTTVGTCNRMETSTDVRGVVTTYGYDPTHGSVTSMTTTNAGGTNPSTQTRYTQVAGVWLPTSTWSCRTLASCENSSDAVKTATQYNTNLLPSSITTGAGDGSVQATSAMTYTAAGDLLTVDGPLSGASDTARYYYDAARQRLGSVGPDPDGSGPLLARALRTSYDSWGRPTTVVRGTATDQSDTALSNMTVLQTWAATLDNAGRTTSVAISAGGTTFARIDYKYDTAGRPTCTAQRMNPNALGSASDGCTVGSDAGFGPDRVTLVQYSPAGAGNPASTSVTSAYGTADAATETVLQTATGKPASVTDANGNVTSYGYDGFDRLSTTTYPGGSYEQLGYDPKGDLTSRRLRDGQTLAYTYDSLGRRSYDDNPNSNIAEVDVSYTYDLLGRLLTANDQNGWTKTFGYDALGRATQQGSNLSNTSLLFDAAGRMTRQTWSDGFFVTYEYDTLGEMTVIRENGSLALASFGYDNLGRRVSLSRGNGTVTTYGYDTGSRLTSLAQDLAGGNWDQTYGFGYNPAGQITSRSSSNDVYAWTGAVNADRSYGVNSLNQYTSAGSTSFGYDNRGDLINSGGTTYQYNTRNQLFMNGAGQLFYRNPAGELGQTPGMNYDWVNGQLATEISGGVQRRYIYGPGADEALVWYEGAGTSDRRYLHADERGSIVAISNDAGNAVAINTYDEYGIPGSSNQGRFQYTGQIWQPELGMYDFKARMYSPTLGRFMQPDPIGYADGLNWHNYAGSDPVNSIDPTGTTSYWTFSHGQACFYDDHDGSSPATLKCQDDYVVTAQRPVTTPPSPVGTAGNYAGTPSYSATTGSPPQSDQAPQPGDVVVTGRRLPAAYYTNRGPSFGILDQFNGNRGILSHASGGWDQAVIDVDKIAQWNGAPAFSDKTLTSGPPAGWFMAPIAGGFRYFTASGLQIRVGASGVNIDIPAGFAVGNGFGDASQFGETVHYGG